MAERAGLMPAQVEPYADVSETHSAVVFFVGDRAYKLKKPVNLGFLDFSTPEARAAACQREAELNRRFAPDVYLGVMEVFDSAGRVCDHLVAMRRMPASRRLSAPRSARSRGYSPPGDPAPTSLRHHYIAYGRSCARRSAACAAYDAGPRGGGENGRNAGAMAASHHHRHERCQAADRGCGKDHGCRVSLA